MTRVFKVGDIVIQKTIGTRIMKVIDLSEDFDEDAKAYMTRIIMDTLIGNSRDSNNSFNEDNHKIFYATCEWCDDNGITHQDTFEERKLQHYEGDPPRTIVEGFVRK